MHKFICNFCNPQGDVEGNCSTLLFHTCWSTSAHPNAKQDWLATLDCAALLHFRVSTKDQRFKSHSEITKKNPSKILSSSSSSETRFVVWIAMFVPACSAFLRSSPICENVRGFVFNTALNRLFCSVACSTSQAPPVYTKTNLPASFRFIFHANPRLVQWLRGYCELKVYLTEPPLKVVWPKSSILNFLVSDNREKDHWNSGIELES